MRPSVLAWVADVLDCSPVDLDVEPLPGGLTSEMHRVRDRRGGDELVLRAMTVEWWVPHAPGLLAREAQVQRMLHGGPVPVPRCVAVDPTGERAGEPVLLMTRLQGRPLLDRADDAVLAATAQVLVRIHATQVDDTTRPRAYQSWAGPGPWPAPDWAGRPEVWERAAAVAAGPAPELVDTFLHRDFNPSNLLWSDVEGAAPSVSGVVDWVETSWGPADLDVAHCAKQLAMLHGPDAADRFVELYEAAGGTLAPADERGYWTALVVLALTGPERALGLWREQGLTRVGHDLARARLEEHLARALEP